MDTMRGSPDTCMVRRIAVWHNPTGQSLALVATPHGGNHHPTLCLPASWLRRVRCGAVRVPNLTLPAPPPAAAALSTATHVPCPHNPTHVTIPPGIGLEA